jgi:hypothetical protein
LLVIAHGQHLLDGRDAGDGLLAELSDAIAERADELAVDIDGAAAHACDDAGVLGFRAVQAGKDKVLSGADGVVEHAEDLDGQWLGHHALEDRVGDAGEAAMHVGERKDDRLARRGGRQYGLSQGESAAEAEQSRENLYRSRHVYQSKT